MDCLSQCDYVNCYENKGLQTENYIINRLSIIEHLKRIKNVVIITDFNLENIKNLNSEVIVYIDLQDICFSKELMDTLVSNPFIVKIFSLFLNYKHEKTHFVPLGLPLWGLDFSKVCTDKDSIFNRNINEKNDMYYNRTLCLLSKNKHKPYNERKKVISMDFYNGNINSFNNSIKERVFKEREAYYLQFKTREAEFSEIGYSFYRSDEIIDVNSLWDILSDVIFVISPPGNGSDCHRTYENLILGNIPILLRTTLCDDGFFERVGCIVVDNYSEITPQFLDDYIEKHPYDPKLKEELLMRYWVDKISSSI